MADILNFYTDIDLKESALAPPVGVAGITGSLTSLSNWDETGSYTGTEKIYRKNINAQSGIVLGGTGAIATIFSPENWVTGNTPKLIDGNTRNAFFINCVNISQGETPNYRGYVFNIDGSQFHDIENDKWIFSPFIAIATYRADPSNEVTTKEERTGYYYYTPNDNEMHAEVFANSWDSNSQFNQIAMYSCNIEEKDYFLFVLGVNNGALHPTNDTACMLIPRSYFKYNIPKPYVGPSSKDSAAEFTPTTPKRDSIASRDLTGKKNPYGFNTGNGLKLLLLSAQEQADIVKRLYTGRSGDDLNAIGQTLSGVIGGNTHRPADELKTMIDAVLCCHIVPVISSGYAGRTNALYTVAGYQLYNPAKAVTQVSDQIITVTTLRTYIAPIVNNFLTYAPYCTVSLSVPFVGDIPLDTSALFASSIYFVFYLDLYTGTLSVDVHLVDDDGRDYIYTTRQTNCAVDIPIMGTGATGNPLQKIASAAGNVASAGVLGAPTAVYNVATATVDAQHATAIGRGASSNIAPYFSQRHCYLVVEYAESANAEDFFTLNGGALEKSGIVGDFRGYTEFSAVDVSGIAGATDAEKRQLEQILKGGVYL